MFYCFTDLKTLSSICTKRACCGKFLKVSEVREPYIIKVTGFAPTISVETMRLYFQNACKFKRNINDIVMEPNNETCFVEFRNSNGMDIYNILVFRLLCRLKACQ